MEDLDEEAKAKRKKEQVEYRNKKRTSNIFMLAATAFEILETLLLIILMFLIVAVILFKCFDPESQGVQIAFQVSTVVIFIGGMILGFLIYKKAVQWAIKKFHLEDILLDDVKRHYIKPTKDEMEEELKR
ncbi:MAG: hypothetical protein K5681_09405 [Treponema sp.]|nr:hypothetical protein [Treponema sp.]